MAGLAVVYGDEILYGDLDTVAGTPTEPTTNGPGSSSAGTAWPTR
jgi:hypothetical protein